MSELKRLNVKIKKSNLLEIIEYILLLQKLIK